MLKGKGSKEATKANKSYIYELYHSYSMAQLRVRRRFKLVFSTTWAIISDDHVKQPDFKALTGNTAVLTDVVHN